MAKAIIRVLGSIEHFEPKGMPTKGDMQIGVITIGVEVEELDAIEWKMLRKLFPHSVDQAQELLNIEALIGSVQKEE